VASEPSLQQLLARVLARCDNSGNEPSIPIDVASFDRDRLIKKQDARERSSFVAERFPSFRRVYAFKP
jgi:hypothetical protein